MEKTINILYAEDDDIGAEVTKIILEENNFSVRIAPDGEQAWDEYLKMKPDLLMLDLSMPKKNGIELIRLVRAQDDKTPIILYTSHGDPKKEIEAIDAGADDYINKEVSSAVLISRLNRIYQRIIKTTDSPHLYDLSAYTTYNSISRVLTIRGNSTQLKPTTGRFLQLLCVKMHQVADQQYLLNGMWGKASIGKESELKKYASQSRQLLKPDTSLKIEFKDNGYILMFVNE